MDTIEVSNLNRQFYFRNEHVGRSKAEVAAEIVRKQNSKLNITAHHRNIMDPSFDLKYFMQFTAVILALDNEEARSYVNKICMITDRLVLEAGTHGFLGQAMILKRNVTRCYDCYPRSKPKTFQVCTIRTLPEKPIHCLVWGKHLFSLMFGPKTDQNLLTDILDKETKIEGSTEEEVARGCFDQINKIFGRLFVDLLQEQIDSNPEKFNHLKLIHSDKVQEVVNFSTLPSEIDYEADSERLHDIGFYIQNFYGRFVLMKSPQSTC